MSGTANHLKEETLMPDPVADNADTAHDRATRDQNALAQARQDEEKRGNSTVLYAVLILTTLALLGLFIHSLSQGVGQTQTAPAVLVNRPAPPPPTPSLPAPVQLTPNTAPVGANGLPTSGTIGSASSTTGTAGSAIAGTTMGTAPAAGH